MRYTFRRWIRAIRQTLTLATQALTASATRLVRRAARTSGYTTAQINAAIELIEDGGIQRLRDGIWLAVSTDGTRIHRCTEGGRCTCADGIKARDAHHRPCFHVLAAVTLAA